MSCNYIERVNKINKIKSCIFLFKEQQVCAEPINDRPDYTLKLGKTVLNHLKSSFIHVDIVVKGAQGAPQPSGNFRNLKVFRGSLLQ